MCNICVKLLLCELILCIYVGRIILDGTPAQLYRDHNEVMTKATGISDPSVHTSSGQSGVEDTITSHDDAKSEDELKTAEPPKTLIVAEKMQSGGVASETYMRYFGSAFMTSVVHTPFYSSRCNGKGLFGELFTGSFCAFVIFIIFSASQLARLSCDFYLSKWSRASDEYKSLWFQSSYYISIAALFILLWFRSSSLNIPAVLSTKNLHETVKLRFR